MSLIVDYLLSSHVESLSSMSSRRYITRLYEDDDYLVYWADCVRTIRLFEAVLSLLVPYWLAATCADQSEAIIQISLSQLPDRHLHQFDVKSCEVVTEEISPCFQCKCLQM